MGPHCWDTLAWPRRLAGAWHSPLALPLLLAMGHRPLAQPRSPQGHGALPWELLVLQWVGSALQPPWECPHGTTAMLGEEERGHPVRAARTGWAHGHASTAPQHPQVLERPPAAQNASFREKGHICLQQEASVQ